MPGLFHKSTLLSVVALRWVTPIGWLALLLEVKAAVALKVAALECPVSDIKIEQPFLRYRTVSLATTDNPQTHCLMRDLKKVVPRRQISKAMNKPGDNGVCFYCACCRPQSAVVPRHTTHNREGEVVDPDDECRRLASRCAKWALGMDLGLNLSAEQCTTTAETDADAVGGDRMELKPSADSGDGGEKGCEGAATASGSNCSEGQGYPPLMELLFAPLTVGFSVHRFCGLHMSGPTSSSACIPATSVSLQCDSSVMRVLVGGCRVIDDTCMYAVIPSLLGFNSILEVEHADPPVMSSAIGLYLVGDEMSQEEAIFDGSAVVSRVHDTLENYLSSNQNVNFSCAIFNQPGTEERNDIWVCTVYGFHVGSQVKNPFAPSNNVRHKYLHREPSRWSAIVWNIPPQRVVGPPNTLLLFKLEKVFEEQNKFIWDGYWEYCNYCSAVTLNGAPYHSICNGHYVSNSHPTRGQVIFHNRNVQFGVLEGVVLSAEDMDSLEHIVSSTASAQEAQIPSLHDLDCALWCMEIRKKYLEPYWLARCGHFITSFDSREEAESFYFSQSAPLTPEALGVLMQCDCRNLFKNT
ncbi:hypothetical protein Pelo_10398 [Pelomyxa schiedti]|nr:hypothetical protein Pelo_10398 [Pelomyxa schiedti]